MRILVTVASRHGATREIGTVVADVLRSAGHDVDELEPEDVGTVEPYAAVVLGSAVYAGRLGAGLRHLVERQGGQLRARPVWLFWSGPVGDPARLVGVEVRGLAGVDLAEVAAARAHRSARRAHPRRRAPWVG